MGRRRKKKCRRITAAEMAEASALREIALYFRVIYGINLPLPEDKP